MKNSLVIFNFSRVDQTPLTQLRDAIWQPCDVHRLYNNVAPRCKSESGSLSVRHTTRKITPDTQQTQYNMHIKWFECTAHPV